MERQAVSDGLRIDLLLVVLGGEVVPGEFGWELYGDVRIVAFGVYGAAGVKVRVFSPSDVSVDRFLFGLAVDLNGGLDVLFGAVDGEDDWVGAP